MPDLQDALNAQRRAVAAQGPAPVELAAVRRMTEIVGQRMERLENEDEWDTFWAQAAISIHEPDEWASAAILDQIRQGALVDDELMRVMLRLQRLLGRVEVFQELRALPRILVERSAAVKKMLDTAPEQGVENP